MRGIVLIGVILGLIYWVASTIDLPDRAAAGALAEQQEPQWRRTSAGWVALETWNERPHHHGFGLDPVTLTTFEMLLAVFVMVAFSRKPPVAAKRRG